MVGALADFDEAMASMVQEHAASRYVAYSISDGFEDWGAGFGAHPLSGISCELIRE